MNWFYRHCCSLELLFSYIKLLWDNNHQQTGQSYTEQAKMRLFTFPLYLLVLLSAITWQVCCEQKVGKIRHLCGGSFRVIWEQCCGHRCGVHAHKRALGETMSAQKASSFLKSTSSHMLKRRSLDDAVEECCNEGCTIEEVSEYKC